MPNLKYQKAIVGILAFLLTMAFAVTVSAKLSIQDIETRRAALQAQNATFTIGPNPATELDLSQLCGLIPPENWQAQALFDDIQPRIALPTSWDWCDQGACTPVKNQGGCGSCWAFGTVGALESSILIQDLVEEDLSEQYLVSCNTNGWGCNGGWWAHDYHQWKYSPPETEAGAVPEDEFPYAARDDPCGGPYSHPWQIHDWAYVGNSYSVPSVSAIKQAMLDYGPVAAAVYVGSDFQAYTGGIFNSNQTGSVNHGIVLVGWDDMQGSDGVWFLRNSWGTGWGEDGYMRIEYGTSMVGYAANYVVYSAQKPSFHLSAPEPGPLYACIPDTLEVQIEVEPTGGFSDPVTLAVSGLPPGLEGSFDSNPVTPPGSSILTITVAASAGTGEYAFEVQGAGGEEADSLGLTLYIGNGPPDSPSLLKPSNGEPLGGYANIRFSWSQVPGAGGYRLQVDDDPGFLSPEADVASIAATSYTLAGPLIEGQTYYWHVSAANGCGEGFFSDAFWFVADSLEVLLVDDDDNDPDVRPHYEAAVGALGYSYRIWDTRNSDNEPSFADLAPYAVVIWFSGSSGGGAAGPGALGEAALAQYLDSGGTLFLTSQGYHYDKGLTTFMEYDLGVESIADDIGDYSSVAGQHYFDGLGPYELDYPFSNHADAVTPGTGTVGFVGSNGKNAGIYTDDAVFFVFPWEAIANNTSHLLESSQGTELLEAIVSYLTSEPVPPCECDLNSDGTCDMLDWLLFGKDWGRTNCIEPGVDPCECDLNGDGRCDMLDWLLFGKDWDRTDCIIP
jgi:C1A family cysteine protease